MLPGTELPAGLTWLDGDTRILSAGRTLEFENRVKGVIKAIPRGKVATYTQVASIAGNNRAARQVVRVLHASSRKDRLPWHRVINSRGAISLGRGRGFEEQKSLLLKEGIQVGRSGRIALEEFQWEPEGSQGLRSRAAARFLRSLGRAESQE